MWNFGKNEIFSQDEMLNIVKNYSAEGFKIYIGTDSQAVGDKYVFAVAICVHHPVKRNGVCYFWQRKKHDRTDFPALVKRLLHEATLSVQTALLIRDYCPDSDIELHFDVASKKIYKSNRYVEYITSYARGCGFKYQIKPHSWAASGAADGHCK